MASRMQRVRRLFVRDPYNAISAAKGVTVARFAPEADALMNVNPNPAYDPSTGSNDATEVSVASARKSASKPGRASRGHAKAVKTNPNLGKTLKRR